MLISPAYAQGAPAGDAGSLMTFLPLILIFVVFYFLLIRPQQKRQKEHKAMVEALKRGDRVVSGGGLYGTVTKVLDDAEIEVEIAEGVKVRMLRGAVQEVVAKPGTGGKPPAKGGRKKKDEAEAPAEADSETPEADSAGEDDAEQRR
jgi:preprotein translocase subunit YajC